MRYDVKTAKGAPLCECVSLFQVESLRGEGLIPDDAVVSPMASADDVRAECARRLCALFGARGEEDLTRKISNASREAIRLLRIKNTREWTKEEKTRAASLEWADMAVEALRACSNVMEPKPPVDFTDDKHWNYGE